VGEVYDVDEAGFARLDTLEGYKSDGLGMYDRVRTGTYSGVVCVCVCAYAYTGAV
jgi:gamma-glutamylcyclotransferase (GGCT)/AIG2-like uncharacterized protein YtfP